MQIGPRKRSLRLKFFFICFSPFQFIHGQICADVMGTEKKPMSLLTIISSSSFGECPWITREPICLYVVGKSTQKELVVYPNPFPIPRSVWASVLSIKGTSMKSHQETFQIHLLSQKDHFNHSFADVPTPKKQDSYRWESFITNQQWELLPHFGYHHAIHHANPNSEPISAMIGRDTICDRPTIYELP